MIEQEAQKRSRMIVCHPGPFPVCNAIKAQGLSFYSHMAKPFLLFFIYVVRIL